MQIEKLIVLLHAFGGGPARAETAGDYGNDAVRKITPGGVVSTLATGVGGPMGVAVDSAGYVYVANYDVHTIAKISPAGAVTTLAGLAGTFGSADGTGSAARFAGPSGLAIDSTGVIIYVSELANNTIRKITPDGVVTTLAGSAGTPGSADGTGGAARFDSPFGIDVDSAGFVYVAGYHGHNIRKITPSGAVTTLAGLAGTPGSADGTGSAARFNYPCGVAIDSAGYAYVADYSNHTMRRGRQAGSQQFEIENSTIQALSGATHSIIADAHLSGGAGTQLNATGTGRYVTYTVPVTDAGTYNVKVGVKTGAKRGIFTMSIGGVAQGKPQDEYTSAIGYGVRDLGTVTFFSGGNKAFKFLVTGKNANSGGYSLGLDYIELVPTTATTRSETESLKVAAISPVPSGWTSSQWFGVFNATAASGGAGTYFNANGVGKFITYTVPVAKAGTYRVKVGVQTKPNKGLVLKA